MDLYWERGLPLGTGERWYPAPGHEGRYEVSTHGRVRRIVGPGAVPRIIKQHPNTRGYLTVTLYWGQRKWRATVRVHRLVARAFLGLPPRDEAGEFHVHHKDGNIENNHAANLDYLSSYDNVMEETHRRFRGH